MNQYPNGTWAVIDFNGDGGRNLVCFFDHPKGYENAFYWGQSRSFAVMLKGTKVIEVLGKFESDEWDDLEPKFFRKYVGAQDGEIKQSAGWIAPDGRWFTCSPSGHDGLAKVLCVAYYDKLDGAVQILEEKGWIRVHIGGMLTAMERVSEILTPKQAETLAKLQDVGDTKWKNNLVRYSRPLGLE